MAFPPLRPRGKTRQAPEVLDVEILGRSVIVSLGAARGCTIAAGVAGRDNSGAGEEYKIGSGCAPEGIRTPNLLIRSQMLYPLSYGRLSI